MLSSTTDDLFRALAAPTRRRILDLLAEHGELTVGELAAEFPDLVASGISKHLMELREAEASWPRDRETKRDGRRRDRSTPFRSTDGRGRHSGA